MANRLDLQKLLEDKLGNKNVYYRPPATLKMQYDAIRYSKKNVDIRRADDANYSQMNCYEIIVIARKPDHPVIEELLKLPYCSWDRWYAADGLNHDVLTLYY